MARIYRTIESLKSLKYELESRGITRFKSVKEIKEFLKKIDSEKLKVLIDTKNELEQEYQNTCLRLKENTQQKVELSSLATEKIDRKITDLQSKIDLIQKKSSFSFLNKILSSIKLYNLKNQFIVFNDRKFKLLFKVVQPIAQKIKIDQRFLNEYENDKQLLIEKRAKLKIEELEYTKYVLEDCKNLISGAIGENLVVKEIKKLSDDFVLINDFKLDFYPPIFYKQQNERIYSIQIDHLLISKAGIFIIETKNWSKKSVNSISLRSPIEQIRRSNFALYIYISENITLHDHHWGEQKIPIRNLIVMINNKPKAQFKYVSIKLLNELNDFINYFDPILSENQLNKITSHLV
ncbi:Nuclease-related domain-containing protein [Maribacter dokdonensis]|uniref:Nuclease-related domain-containing protein n=1 Tax=Maribacter dokdonensis TaxID=320912 RepID=A0ABY0U0Q4_9FLAO|nr:nuclease-related domain-containing protein [Maribacter dokdonensis]SDR87990.1 Nuclease-related domain-containing protein [Maribacter dokdonensis]